MGPITLPSTGTIYIDANTLIYSVETDPTYWPLLEPDWIAARAGQFKLVSSELIRLEVLVIPMRTGDLNLIDGYKGVLGSPEMSVMPVNTVVLHEAAQLRAATKGLRSPDAIHAATALLHRTDLFLTNDPGFRRIPGLPVDLLSDHL